jgi:hypothetical protein
LKGWVRDIDFSIYYDYGIDDIGSMIDWMIKNGFWKKTGQKIKASDFDQDCSRDKLIEFFENDFDLLEKLRELIENSWFTIENSLKLGRKSKYNRR